MNKGEGLSRVLAEAPRNCWLALDEDETKVVGHGKTPEDALAEAHANGVADPILMWAPETWLPQVL
jgi:hypothetical protein